MSALGAGLKGVLERNCSDGFAVEKCRNPFIYAGFEAHLWITSTCEKLF